MQGIFIGPNAVIRGRRRVGQSSECGAFGEVWPTCMHPWPRPSASASDRYSLSSSFRYVAIYCFLVVFGWLSVRRSVLGVFRFALGRGRSRSVGPSWGCWVSGGLGNPDFSSMGATKPVLDFFFCDGLARCAALCREYPLVRPPWLDSCSLSNAMRGQHV